MDGLINYWSFCASYNDSIGEANGYEGQNAALTSDRFGVALSALDLSNGYIQIPPGIYFNGDYTVTSWIYIRSFTNWARIIDFGNEGQINNVVMAFAHDSSGQLGQYFTVGSSWLLFFGSTRVLPLNTWLHVAFVLSYPNAFIYINGSLDSTATATGEPKNLTRTSNFIGRSHKYPVERDANAVIDELKIYNRGLNESEVNYDMTNQKYAKTKIHSTTSTTSITFYYLFLLF